MKTFDLVVIGGGPGGYPAAIRAAQLGASTCLVEQGQLGGTCTNRGCIPTKVLASSAHLLSKIRRADEMGVVLPGTATLDFGRVAERREQVSSSLRDGIGKLLAANGVERCAGIGKLDGPGRVVVEGTVPCELGAKSIVVATGSIPAHLPMLPVDGEHVLTSDELLQETRLPRRMVVVGGGVIGCEFASIYHAFGVEVTVIELLDRLLPSLDPALSLQLARAFRKTGIRFLTSTAVEGVTTDNSGATVRLPAGERIECDRVLVSVGRKANTAGIGLEQAGVRTERGRILTDECMATGVAGVYAIGDAVGKTWLAHVATKEGEVAAACAVGQAAKMRYDVVPSVVFTEPEMAVVGLGATEAKSRGIEIDTGTFHFGASGKALCDGISDGRVEILSEKGSGRIVGGWVVGEEAGVLIAELTLAVNQGMTARELSEVIHAHPTLPEMIMEAAADTAHLAIHRAPSRKQRRS